MTSLAASPVGKLVPITEFDARHGEEFSGFAFVPDPLPADVELEQTTWKTVVRAMQELSRLDQAGALIPNPGLLRRPLLRREAVSTSALEGTHAAFSDVLEADVTEDRVQSPEVREVRNYVGAAEFAIKEISNGRPLSVALLSDAHRLLVRHTKSDGTDAGKVRTRQVIIGADGCRIDEARFIPAPPDDRLKAGLDSWEHWLRRASDLPAVVRAAMAHYQFETLHPFHDGNGRIGRLAILLQLMTEGALREALLEVSPWLEARRADYQDQLFALSQTGNWDPWVRFFATAVRDQSASAVDRVNGLIEYQRNVHDVLWNNGVRGGAAMHIAEGLVGQPVISVSWAARMCDVTFPAANHAIQRLVSLGVLEEVTGRDYGRIFVATPVLRIVER
jgi:Fic family protein